MIKVAFLGNNEDKVFKHVFFCIMKQLELEPVKLSSNISKDSFKYVVINSSVIIKENDIKCSHLLINMDNVSENNIYISANLITYGFGNKNTVTISSIENENLGFVYCLQRFVNVNSIRILEPQEIPILTQINSEDHLYPYMVGITIALLEGIKCEEVKKKLDSSNLIFSI